MKEYQRTVLTASITQEEIVVFMNAINKAMQEEDLVHGVPLLAIKRYMSIEGLDPVRITAIAEHIIETRNLIRRVGSIADGTYALCRRQYSRQKITPHEVLSPTLSDNEEDSRIVTTKIRERDMDDIVKGPFRNW